MIMRLVYKSLADACDGAEIMGFRTQIEEDRTEERLKSADVYRGSVLTGRLLQDERGVYALESEDSGLVDARVSVILRSAEKDGLRIDLNRRHFGVYFRGVKIGTIREIVKGEYDLEYSEVVKSLAERRYLDGPEADSKQPI